MASVPPASQGSGIGPDVRLLDGLPPRTTRLTLAGMSVRSTSLLPPLHLLPIAFCLLAAVAPEWAIPLTTANRHLPV